MRKVKARVKKTAALFIAMIMVLAMGISAFAAETYTIKITTMDSSADHQFEAYQIFSGTLSSEGTLSDVAWGSGVGISDETTFYNGLKALTVGPETPFANLKANTAASVSDVLSEYNIDTNKDGEALAEAFQDYITTYLSTTSTTITPVAGAAGSYQATGVAAGYYLVKDEADTNAADLMLRVVGNVDVTAKMDIPSVEKYAGEKSVADNANFSAGTPITYTLVGTMPNFETDKAYAYTFTDTMEAALTLNYTPSTSNETQVDGGVKVTLGENGTDITSSFSSITYVTNDDGTHTLTVSSTDLSGVGGISADSKIYVTYDAVINDNVATGADISNGVKLTSKVEDSVPTETPVITEQVYPITLDVTKIDGKNETTTLAGAEFILYREEGNVKSYATIGTNGKITGWTNDESLASIMTTDADGKINVVGLSAGTFYLKETKAPTGYNQLKKDIEVAINAVAKKDGAGVTLEKLTYSINGGNEENGNNDNGTVSFNVENNQGAQLPSTGGIGTTIFYVLGGIFVVGAGVLLIVRKRMNTEK